MYRERALIHLRSIDVGLVLSQRNRNGFLGRGILSRSVVCPSLSGVHLEVGFPLDADAWFMQPTMSLTVYCPGTYIYSSLCSQHIYLPNKVAPQRTSP